MRIKRIIAVCIVFIIAAAGWWILATATAMRSSSYFSRLGSQVEALWGVPLTQQAPSFNVQIPGTRKFRKQIPLSNQIRAVITANHRRKGLIWYPTFQCRFEGAYRIKNDDAAAQKIRFHFDFPTKSGTYDDFSFTMDGVPQAGDVDARAGVDALVTLAPGESRELKVSYVTRGMRQWRYQLDRKAGHVRHLDLQVVTNFEKVDYTNDSLSPMSAESIEDGKRLNWKATHLITGANIGVVVPEKRNPGPLTSRITFFAPVCLVFFFVLTAAIHIMYRVEIHPMHYLFVAAGFFAFHLLLVYLVGHINIHLAFALSAGISMFLVTGYLRAALGKEFPWRIALGGQFFYLVLFSYSFFLDGFTGITIAVGSVVTLAVLMKVTATVDWNQVFAQTPKPRREAQTAIPGF